MKLTTNHIIIVLLALLLLYKCNEKPRIETITAAPRVVEKIKVLHDTVTKLKTRFKTKYDTIIKQAPDTCHTYINTIYEECNDIITLYDTIVVNYIVLDSIKEQDYKQQIRKYKRSRIKWFGAGLGIGYLTGKIL